MTPQQVIADGVWESGVSNAPLTVAQSALDALHSAGYEVVSHHLLDACRQLAALPTHDTLQVRADALQRIKACVAVHDEHDELDVFTEGGGVMCDHPNREAAMIALHRDDYGTPTVWCDPCIADLVEVLQPLGTVWSCCGHGRLPPTVGLEDGRQVIVVESVDEARRVHETCWPGVTINDPMEGGA